MASSSTLPQVQFTGPTKIVGYTLFGGPQPQPARQLYAWEGPPGGVAVLTPETGYSDPAAMSNIVNWLSSAYQFYFTVTGHDPAPNIEVDGPAALPCCHVARVTRTRRAWDTLGQRA